MTQTTLVLVRRLPAPVDKVYAAWTDPALLSQWYGPEGVTPRNIVCEPSVGGRIHCEMVDSDGGTHTVSGVFREVIPEQKIVHTWQWKDSDNETLVTVDFKALDNCHTELTLTHERFPDSDVRDKHEGGWSSSLVCLQTLFSG